MAFESLEGAPDLGAIDLSGADFTAADLAGVNLDGASFRDAILLGVEAIAGSSFVETDFSGADLRGGALGGIARADFTGARLDGARIRFWHAITLEGATLADASLRQTEQVGGGALVVELSLAGLDLTPRGSRASRRARTAGDNRPARGHRGEHRV